jgi:hypothetical protein
MDARVLASRASDAAVVRATGRTDMRSRWIFAGLMLAAAAPAAQAQQTNDTGIPTETQERLREGVNNDIPWDLLGLFGLIGLLGLRKEHSDDSYHPSPVE